MPTIRYQIRNEYGLADPELYRVTDNEDPEALLEGVAMAGLVGVLRQLGDLAEFAAEIFHDLHEEVTATAARGHELMLRVQQVEAEFPSIEKAFLTQTNHSQFAYNEGIDWHANLRADQNLVTQGDMPRFILDSYEECRGPPRLFMLDKFDVAGAGACLKRYSDPSFFKVELASSGLMEEDVLRERKSRKIKKKGSRWRDGETAASFLAPLINSNLQPESSGHISAKVPRRRVKPKSRNLHDSEITNRKSYMEQLLQPLSQDQKVWPENSICNSLFGKGCVASSGLTPEVPEAIIEAIADSPIVGVGNHTVSLTEELDTNKVKGADILGTIPIKTVTSESKNERESSYLSHKPEKSLLTLLDMKRPLSDAEGNKSQKIPILLANVDPKKSLASTEFTPKGNLDDCKSDGMSSDLDNYLDGLNTIESEFETDSESRDRSEQSFSNMRAHGMDSESCQPKQELSDQIPLDAVENSITSKELNRMIEHSFSKSDISHDVVDTQLQNHENGFDVTAGNNNVEEYAESVHVLCNASSNVNELDVASIKSEVGDAYSGSFLSDSASSHVNSCTQGNDEAQSADPLQDDSILDYVKGRLVVTEKLDCKVKELSEFCSVSSTFLDEFTLLSKKGDSSVETKDEGIYPAVHVEEQNSVTLGSSVVTSDHLPTAKTGSTFEVIAPQNIEPIVDLTAKSEEEEQNLVEQDGEACFSGSVLPSIPEASPEFGTTVLCPKKFSYGELKHDISSSHQVAEDLDNMSALTEESFEFPLQAYSDMKFTEPSKTSSESSDQLLSLFEIHGEVSSIGNPKDIDTEISSHEVENFQEVSSDLDGTLPFIGEPSEFLSGVYNDMEFTRPMENTGCFEDLLPLSEIPEKNSTPDVEPNLLEDSEDIQGKSSAEEVLVMHVEGSTPVSNVQLRGLIESTEHDNKNSSSENLSPSHSSLSLRNSQFDTQPDDFTLDVGNTLAVHKGSDDDDMEEGKHVLPLAGPVEPECTSDQDKPRESEALSPRKEESPDGICPPFKCSTNDMGEVNILKDNAGSLELANISEGKEPNESHDADLARNLPSDVVFSDDVPLQNEEIGCMVTSDEEEPKEAFDADAEEHLNSCPVNEMFSDGSHMHEEEPGCVRIDSISPVADFSHELIADASEFPNASKEEILQKEMLRLDEDTEFDDPSDEYVIIETDGDNQGTTSIYSGKASGFDAHLQENYLQHNTLLAEHDLDVNEASNSTSLNRQDVSPSISSAEAPSSELTILKSCNDSDVGSLDGAGCSEPSKDPEPDIASENLVYQPGNVDSVSIEVKFPHIPSSVEAEISSGDDSEANVAFSDEGEPSAVSDQESEHLEASGTQPQRACVDENNITQSICKNIEDQPSQPEPFGYLSSGESNELDAPLSNSGMHEKVKNDTSVASDFSSEISSASLLPSVSSAGLQLVENSSHNLSEASIHETSESGPEPSSSSNLQVVDETPPLPPLPPVEWRIGKLRLGSVVTSGDPLQHQLVTSPFTELRTGDESYSQGPVTTKVEKVQSAKHFSCLPVTENERFHNVSLISEEEISHPSKLSDLCPVEDEVREESSQIVDGEIENRPAPFIAVSHTEDRKSLSYNTASVSTIDDETIQHPPLSQGGGQSAQHRGLQLSHLLRSLELERSQLEAFNVARNPVSPLNPFVVVSSPEEWKNQYGYRVYGHECGQHINMSAPFAATGPNLPPYGFLYPVGENPSNIYDFMIPSTEGEKKYRSIRDRPRDPLIEAVAAHDKSKLRKVSDLDRLPVRATTDERNSLLEQIKNKSFNLKPANSTKPNIKGVPGVPPTNLKIAAILEKANAIRQACVGSDEDEDDADSWGDS